MMVTDPGPFSYQVTIIDLFVMKCDMSNASARQTDVCQSVQQGFNNDINRRLLTPENQDDLEPTL